MTTIFGQEMSPTVAALVYVFLGVALVILVGSIWYYWNYARKIERFLERDNVNNNMMRQDLVDSFVERGEEEWPCSICFHDNHPTRTTCIMCGTPMMMNNSPSLVRASGFQRKDLERMNSTMLNQQSRVRSFHVRRLKQMDLTSRQKAAVRRHLWKRKRGTDGKMHWVRIDAQHTDTYNEIHTPKSTFRDSNDTRSRSSSSDSLAEHNHHIALALRDFGEDPSASGGNTLLSASGYFPRPSFQPLRATALKRLEEAEERPTMISNPYQNPFNPMSSMVKLKEDDKEQQDREDRRLVNDTAVSTGYVRHSDGEGGVEWTPAGTIRVSDSTRQIQCDDDLEEIAALTFHEKNKWFLAEVQKRWRNYDEGHIQFVVRREHLVSDSMEQMLKCPPSRFWERLRIYFENEPGLDAGGLIREWYEKLSESLFNDDFGLFISTKGENLGYWINPASASKVKDHLHYYEFVGRLLAKALIEGYNMKMSLALPLIKHILSVPISFSDLEFLDEDLYKNAMWMKKNDHAELLNIDFTVQVITSEGKSTTEELKPGGSNIDVTDANKKEYLELLLKHYMFRSISDQLGALLKGFYDVMPAFLLSVFDYQEFDLLLSGIPDIDVSDWHAHSEVRWIKLEKPSPAEHRVLEWFWEILAAFTAEERARLLQFATGTSRVPVQGFKALMSSDGRVRRFTIQFVQRGPPPTGLMPKGHTCFNRIDLPLYHTMEELMNYLTLVINMEISGFWME
uniref:HECT-type E3 ubiquitin transferase n=1 Tax=Globisporangium ultimum (strain ATCC 200006 / CBS 805.95 / DAOM BR144) TaxID=431595 RepID=K3WCL7_GLOUD